MGIFDDLVGYLSKITTMDEHLLSTVLATILVLCVFSIIKKLLQLFINKSMISGRREFLTNQFLQITINLIEILALLAIWSHSIKNLVTLISVISAAMTIALREVIVNFFCGLYIKIKRPFKVEDRIEIDDIRGDVMSISHFEFEIVEVSTKEEHGQSTGVVVTFPTSVILTKPVKNITKGFKYVWNELVIKLDMDCDLVKNKREIYKIVNNLETIKNIPIKMKREIEQINSTNRIYFNQYEPMIYTRIVEDHIELTVRYLMHPKKARYVESVIWNKIYLAYKDKKIDLYVEK